MKNRKNRRGPRGEGTCYFSEAKGCWVARATIQGQRREVTARRQIDALAKINTLRARNAPPAASRPFSQHIDAWLAAVVARGRQERTIDTYRTAARLHVVPALGRVPLSSLTGEHLERMTASLLAGGLHRETVQKAVNVAKMAAAHAARSRAIGASPFLHVRLEQRDALPRVILTPEETCRAVAAAAGGRWHAALAVLATTGLRRGELLALSRRHVGPGGSFVRVEQSLYAVPGGGLAVKVPKTRRGRRVVSLPPGAAATLQAHLDRTPGSSPESPLFGSVAGGHAGHQSLTRAWARALVSAGLRQVRLHDLRHGHGSHLIASGVVITEVAARLGDSVNTVVRTYAHEMPNTDLREQVARLYPAPLLLNSSSPVSKSRPFTDKAGRLKVKETPGKRAVRARS